jgi:hypothetical protein
MKTPSKNFFVGLFFLPFSLLIAIVYGYVVKRAFPETEIVFLVGYSVVSFIVGGELVNEKDLKGYSVFVIFIAPLFYAWRAGKLDAQTVLTFLPISLFSFFVIPKILAIMEKFAEKITGKNYDKTYYEDELHESELNEVRRPR